MNRVRCGVIGAGWWGTFAHIPAILRHPAAELVAVQNPDPLEGKKIVEAFGVPRVCRTPEELLGIADLDAVVVSSTPNLHYAQARSALERGLHVLVEKPMTLTATESKKLVAVARDRGLHLLVSCPWHFTAHALEARKRIRDGELGEVRMVSILMTNPVAHLVKGLDAPPTHSTSPPLLQPRAGSYSEPAVAGGGQIYTQVSHVTAYLPYLLGVAARRVFARFHNDGANLDIYDTLNITLENGTLASIASTGATSLSQRSYEVRIFGTRAIIYLELWQGTMTVLDVETDRRIDLPPLSPHEIFPHEAPATNLIDCVLGLSENLSPGEFGAVAVEIIEAANQSAKTQADVRVGLAESKACVAY